MPGARTYQAIGYATYHGGRFYGEGRSARERERRPPQEARAEPQAAVGVAVVVAVVGSSRRLRRGAPSRMPTSDPPPARASVRA